MEKNPSDQLIIFSLVIDVAVFGVSFDLARPYDQVKLVGMLLILVPTAAMMLRRRSPPSAPEEDV